MFALVDCNNFYVSCERLFRPDLWEKPVAVLSNNDGCIIARSQEVRALGIPMGAPRFQYEPLLKKHHVHLFSSNFELYADISHRVIQSLKLLAPLVEEYSIDECFLGLHGLNQDFVEYGWHLRQTLLKWTGIPTGVGIGPTKTLAKLANQQAKNCGGVCVLTSQNHDSLLKSFPVGDLWGIGRKHQKKLNTLGIYTAADLCAKSDLWIRKHLTVQGLRLVYELRGISCLPLTEIPDPQKALAVTRSFSTRITDWQPLREAISHYATRAGEKLRTKKLQARYLQVFLHTSRHSKDPYYDNAAGISLPEHTQYTPTLINYAIRLLKSIYREGFRYSKCGIILMDLIPDTINQTDFFSKTDSTKQHSLMATLDILNRKMGKNTLHFATSGTHQSWSMNRQMLSPCYTTKWQDLRTIQ